MFHLQGLWMIVSFKCLYILTDLEKILFSSFLHPKAIRLLPIQVVCKIVNLKMIIIMLVICSYLDNIRVTMGERTSVEGLLPSHWAVGISIGYFLDLWLIPHMYTVQRYVRIVTEQARGFKLPSNSPSWYLPLLLLEFLPFLPSVTNYDQNM